MLACIAIHKEENRKIENHLVAFLVQRILSVMK
jgi:hypothetical protein